MNTSGFQVHFLSCSRNISVQLVWGLLDVAGDIVAIQWTSGKNHFHEMNGDVGWQGGSEV